MKLPLSLQQRLDEREKKGTLRAVRAYPDLVDFYSNDYLGLARSPLLRLRLDAALAHYAEHRTGATGSRLLSGTDTLTLEVENELAVFHRAGTALLFSSGYAANTGFFSALPQRGDTIFYDEASHASIKDGIRLSFAKAFSFRHNDPDDLRRKLSRATGQVYVAVEAVYSMDGDLAPLPDLAALCQENGALLVVDEAHSNGLYGPHGAGLVSQYSLEEHVFARIVTFGKALGSHGAAVLGHASLKEFLINFSRPFIYTTSLPLHSLLAIREAYRLLPVLDLERADIERTTVLLKDLLAGTALRYSAGSSPIQAVYSEDPHRLRQAAAFLETRGYLVRPVLSPTVPLGQERLRIIVHAYNTPMQIVELTQLIANAL